VILPRLMTYAVYRYKPLNSNRKPFPESRLWFRPRACQNGFFTFQFSVLANQALLPRFSYAAVCMNDSGRDALPQKGFTSGSYLELLCLQSLFALTKRCFLHLLPRF
jgi:hypothetical protein